MPSRLQLRFTPVFLTFLMPLACLASLNSGDSRQSRETLETALYDSTGLENLSHQIEAFRERDRVKAKQYFGDVALISKATKLLKEGTPASIARAHLLQMRYVDLLIQSGAVRKNFQEQASAPNGIHRWSTLRYFARLEPKKVSRTAFHTLMGMVFLIEKTASNVHGHGAEAKEELRQVLMELAHWTATNPLGAADFLYQLRLFQSIAASAIEDLVLGDDEIAKSLALDIHAMCTQFMIKTAGTPRMHRFPRQFVEYAVKHISEEKNAQIGRIYEQALFDGIYRTALLMAISGSIFSTGGTGLAALAPAIASMGWNTLGSLAAKDALDRALTGDDKKFYSWSTFGDVFYAASVFAYPLNKAVAALKLESGTTLSGEIEARMTRAARAGSTSARLLSGTEKALTGLSIASSVGWTGYNLVYQAGRLIHADRIAREESTTPWAVAAESVAFLVLRGGSAYLQFKDWSTRPEEAKKQDLDRAVAAGASNN